MSPTITRKSNLEKRNTRLRAQFQKLYTDQPKPRKYTREYIIAKLAEQFFLSMSTVERIVLTKDK